MTNYIQGDMIRKLREQKKMTQRQLGEAIGVSDKTVSKWENQRGLPDITLIDSLSQVLGVSVAQLFSGHVEMNRNGSGNMLRMRFFVCPICGNVITALGDGDYHCCGVKLIPLEGEECDANHLIDVADVDGQWQVRVKHPMTKEHYLSFLAYVTSNQVILVKLYPEQEAVAHFPKCGHGKLFSYCNWHGLYQVQI